MYPATVALLMFVFPITSIVIESVASGNPAGIVVLAGKWFVFWGVGVRLLTAGVRQILKPELTARDILGITDKKSWQVVRELGIANVSIGLLGIFSLFKPEWTLPAAMVGGLFYGLAGALHISKPSRDLEENIATYSDLFMFLVLVMYFVGEVSK